MDYNNGNKNYKSNGERKIGMYLNRQGLDFTYEKPIAVADSGKTKIWFPDFYLNDYHIIVEYLGMNGNPYNDRINEYKRKIFKENKYDVKEIYPSDFKRDWHKKIDNSIYKTLEHRVVDYLSKSSYSQKLMNHYKQKMFNCLP